MATGRVGGAGGAGGATRGEPARAWPAWLDAPVGPATCAAGWLAATALFVALVALLGGPTLADARESIYATWAVEHGHLACAYAPASSVVRILPLEYQVGAHAPPMWPLLSGGLAALFHIGGAVAFPSGAALGAHCSSSTLAMYVWSASSGAVQGTLDVGYASWLVLLAGVVTLVRASGRGRRGWEVAAVLLVALTPVVWLPLLEYFHPQDLVALGLVLAGVACVLRRQWVAAGILLGLAVSAQQFALLAVLPVLVVLPHRERWRVGVAALGAWIALSASLVVTSPHAGLSAVLFGTGDADTKGGTVLWELGFRGAALTLLARALPFVAAGLTARWARRALGGRVLDPGPLVSVVALCLGFRVVFEEGLYGYKLMPLAVMLVLLAVITGRIRGELVMWVALATLAFDPVPQGLTLAGGAWGTQAVIGLQAVALSAICAVAAVSLCRRLGVSGNVALALVFVGVAGALSLAVTGSVPASLPKWLWQVLLVGSAMVLVARPLGDAARAVAVAGWRQPGGASDVVPEAAWGTEAPGPHQPDRV